MKKVVIQDATLYLGDCREILPTLGSVDAVITDPPYGIGFAKAHTKWSANRGVVLGEWDNKIPDVSFLLDLAPEVIIWGGDRFSLPVKRGWLTWVKPDAAPTFSSTEFAWTNKDRPARHFVYSIGQTNGERVAHPTQKPVALMVWCIKRTAGKIVFDPFMGSGTTGVACAEIGRKFIGVEIEEKYFDIACKRIEAAYAQPRMFNDQAAQQAEQGGYALNDRETLDDFQKWIGGWNTHVFGTGVSRARPTMVHLKREIDELDVALSVEDCKPTEKLRHEAADVAILLLALCDRVGFSLRQAIEEKMAVNVRREWGTPDADGVIEHIERRPP